MLDKAHDINCTSHGGYWDANSHACTNHTTLEYSSSLAIEGVLNSTMGVESEFKRAVVKSPADEFFQ